MTPPEAGSLSIVIAARNEEPRVRRTTVDLLRVARRTLPGFELILVNDGSTDGTGAVMDRLAHENPEVTVVHHPRNLGLGAVFQTGLERAQMEKILLMPGDSAYEADSLEPFFARSAAADLVIGSRSNLGEAVSPARLLISKLYMRLMTLLFSLPLDEVHGSTMYPCAAVRAAGIQSKGITFQIETIVKLIWMGVSVSEGPIRLNVTGERSSSSFCWKSFESIVRTSLYLLSVRRNLKARAPYRARQPRVELVAGPA